ncbi:MAG: Rieske (2Fe-2S) protein [Candidatus Abyssobacteria bacterium SURF_5]|jgi:cytochrome b6-f complex iron-sulfur subunit|uniref:Rieske (2Fe-2S) protein n=1 Tax=Abyssobacteria bacterium (strain SURF_5) TaxID=2093360 RepID=A0A3A4P789_ABYX5|nr:MAG: Rieske (2Fe-2S) protein [Candidatus Abyssubacteria bacterium SURF_5]
MEAGSTAGDKVRAMSEGLSRRELLHKSLSVIGWGSLFALSGAGAIQTVRFFSPTVVFHPPSIFEIGTIDNFSSGADPDAYGVVFVEPRWKTEQRFFVIREASRIYALFARCTHLGCTVNWFPGLGIYKCPCHGSQFYSNGVNFAGPAPRPLDRLKISQNTRGNLVVDTSQIFTIEEFEKQEVFIKV